MRRSLDRIGDGPFGVDLALGAVVAVGATLMAALAFGPHDPSARLLVVAVAVGGCAVALADIPAGLGTALIGYLLYTGFLVNRYGTLSWDGASSGWHLLELALAGAAAIPARWWRRARAERRRDEELSGLLADGDAETYTR